MFGHCFAFIYSDANVQTNCGGAMVIKLQRDSSSGEIMTVRRTI